MRPGTQLGHYEIVSALGKGGMGEVWRARDAKFWSEVAIETLRISVYAGSDDYGSADIVVVRVLN